MATPKKPNPVFEVCFEGRGLYPENIPLGSLTTALSAIRRLASGSDAPDEEEEEEEGQATQGMPEDGSIRLVEVKRGSAAYRFTAPSSQVSLDHLKDTGRILENPDEFDGQDFILRPVDLLSAIARRLECSILVRTADKDKAILARIGPNSHERVSEHLFLVGETSLTGRVERVGGATGTRCALRVPSQSRLLYCRVANDEVARQLGNYLYQEVAVTGKARWFRSSWKVVGFTVYSVYQPQPGSLAEAFQALRDAGGHGWDGVADPKAFLEEVSGQ